MITRHFIRNKTTTIPDNIIYYTSNDERVVWPNSYNFGASLVENTYTNGQGMMVFDVDVTSIGDYAFRSCSSLTSITIPNSVTSIGDYAFFECSNLPSMTIPDSVTSVGEYAFRDCTSLTSIVIPYSVTIIGDWAFSGCSSLPVENNLRYADTYLVEAVDKTLSTYSIKDGTRWIGNTAFYDCKALTSITIPNSVTSIGNHAFFSCSSLPSVTIGESVTSIGEQAFCYCASLTSINIPNSVTSIGDQAFQECTSIASVTIGNSVMSIGLNVFTGCFGLTSITWNAESCADFPFVTGYGFTDIRSQITSFIFGDRVKHIPAYTCYYMNNLTSITIPNSVTTIGEGSFYLCYGLTSISIGNSITSIGSNAFYECTSLTHITCEAITPPTLGSGNGRSSVTAVYVPFESVDAYKAADGWSYYADKILPIS